MSDLGTQALETSEKQPNDFGVLYFVDENPEFRKMLKMSIQSLNRFHPEWPIHIIESQSLPIPVWKRLYRIFSLWKRKRRRNRANQDFRIIAEKANAWMKTPFGHTLFLDVDTIITQPLNEMRKKANGADVMAAPLGWKSYKGVASWQPKTFPYMMSGVVFYKTTFLKKYKKYAKSMAPIVNRLPTGDQYIFSLTCELESSNLEIIHEPSLQLDVINMEQEIGSGDFPRAGECLDLRWEGLSRFHVFHYNEYKPQYMKQIKEVWGYPLDE